MIMKKLSQKIDGIKALTALAGAALLLAAGTAGANVSLRNGNFFMGYTDIIYPGGFEPKMERVYNSKTAYKGIYGWGWGTEYEVNLVVSADGSVVVHEYGGGAENRFIPVNFNKAELDKAVDMIAGAMVKAELLGKGEALEKEKARLRSDVTYRNERWKFFTSKGKLQPRQLAPGTQLQSNRFSYQYITKVKDGYIRNFDNGRIEKFNDLGKLTRISDKNNNFIELTYGKDGKLQKLMDNFNRKMFFAFNREGYIESIDGENGKRAEFKYNNLGELISSKDVDGNVYRFKYSSDRRHNMTEIAYSDGTSMQMGYYGREGNESIKTVKDRDGTLTEYAYEFDKSDRGHYTVGVTVKGTDKKVISTSKYEYFIKYRADGEEFLSRLVATLDGDATDTTYDERFGLPTRVQRGQDVTNFVYDAKGHVIVKDTPVDLTKLTYDPKVSKVTRVERGSKTDIKDRTWSEFKYDAKGNLIFAKNSEGKGVKLFYDGNGRIKSLLDQNKRRIDFKYNENSKPVEITDPSLGSITVSYTNAGDIKKVESSAGRKIALQVTTAFQNLLDIIKPAGVNLSF
jgi:YD repeat-containing protein